MSDYTLIAGPGCPPSPHRVPYTGRSCVLTICVELRDGEPVSTLYSGTDNPFDLLEKHQRYPVVMECLRVEAGQKRREKMTDCTCRRGRVCVKHGPEWARRTWAEMERRCHERRFLPCNSDGSRIRTVGVLLTENREDALTECRRLGVSHLRTMDGHCHTISVERVQ